MFNKFIKYKHGQILLKCNILVVLDNFCNHSVLCIDWRFLANETLTDVLTYTWLCGLTAKHDCCSERPDQFYELTINFSRRNQGCDWAATDQFGIYGHLVSDNEMTNEWKWLCACYGPSLPICCIWRTGHLHWEPTYQFGWIGAQRTSEEAPHGAPQPLVHTMPLVNFCRFKCSVER
jgi:hypothetical protein